MADNPKDFDPVVTYDSEVVYWPMWKKTDGTGIKNGANAPFPKPIVEPISIGIVHVFKWVDAWGGSLLKQQLNKTNDGMWNGYAEDQAWISRITARREEENGFDLWRLHYIVKCNEYGWKTNIPHIGYYHLDGGEEKAFKTVDDYQYIGFMTNAGVKTTTPEITEFRIKGQLPFNTVLGVN